MAAAIASGHGYTEREDGMGDSMTIGQLGHHIGLHIDRVGKTVQAIKRYRELNGATLDEARTAIARL